VSEADGQVVHAYLVYNAARGGWSTRLTALEHTPCYATVRALVDSLVPQLHLLQQQEQQSAVGSVAASASALSQQQQQQQQVQDEKVKVINAEQKVTAAAPAAVPVPAANALFASQRRQLMNMGFGDDARVDALLAQHAGDIVSVVSALIN